MGMKCKRRLMGPPSFTNYTTYPADTDVFKTSLGRLKKVTTSYDQKDVVIYDVWKTSYLRRLKDVQLATS